jgi:phage tail sheath gpL-like
MEKIINSIEIENARYYIKSTGETRRIKIRGTRGAGFSMEINDSSGTCILNEPLQNIYIPETGVYMFTQEFPDITTSASGGLTEEYYDIIFKPHADVNALIQEQRLYQYPDVTITLNTTSSATSPSITVRDDDGVYSGTTVTMPARSKGVVNKTLNLTINEASGTAGFFYVKNTYYK